MSVRRDAAADAALPDGAEPVARLALAECRLRGLPAAEEYRVIADRLYRSGFRDLPPGLLVEWIERAVAADYERLLRLRALGERLCAAIAADDVATAGWLLGSELDPAARARLVAGLQRIDQLARDRSSD